MIKGLELLICRADLIIHNNNNIFGMAFDVFDQIQSEQRGGGALLAGESGHAHLDDDAGEQLVEAAHLLLQSEGTQCSLSVARFHNWLNSLQDR